MITSFLAGADRMHAVEGEALREAVWIDLLDPTAEERAAVEGVLGLGLPTREEMREIEASSRLYRDGNTLYMTAPVLTSADTPEPRNAPVTFVFTAATTVTVRHLTPKPFARFAARVQRHHGTPPDAAGVLAGLLEALIDRLADVLEGISDDLDAVTRAVFRSPSAEQAATGRDFQPHLTALGRNGDLMAKARESLLALGRTVTFLGGTGDLLGSDGRQRVATMARDVDSLAEHADYLAGHIAFLLEATLGLINIQQNGVIRVLSLVAVVFLPPTLIASIYGMNFRLMPELGWALGYPLALLAIVLSAALPYLYFKRRGWL